MYRYRSGAPLVLAHNQGQCHLPLRRHTQARADAAPGHIDLRAHMHSSRFTRHLLRVWDILLADRDYQGLRGYEQGQFALWKQRQQAFQAKSEAAGIYIARAAHRAHKAIIATAAAQLGIEPILVPRVNLKHQTGVVTDAAPQSQVQHNLLILHAALFDRLDQLLQLKQWRRVKLIAIKQIAYLRENSRRRARERMQRAQKFQGVKDLAALFHAPGLPQKPLDNLSACRFIAKRDTDTVEQRQNIARVS